MVSNRFKYSILLLGLLPIIYLGASTFINQKAQFKEYFGKIKPRWEYQSSQYDSKSPPTLILSVQGGATNTKGVLFRFNPNTSEFIELSRETDRGSSLNHNPEQALAIVRNFINKGVKRYPDEPVMVVMGMAGTEFAGGRGLFLNGLAENKRITRAILTSDAETAWLSVFDKEGLIIIVGTGGITLAVTKDGHSYQSGGFGGPISDYPSATSLVFDYDRCSESIISLNDGHWHYSTPLPLLQQWIKKHGGSPENYFAYRSQLLTSGQNEEYASRAKDIINYYREELAGYESNNAKVTSLLPLTQKTNSSDQPANTKGDYCANYAVRKAFAHFKEELVAKHNKPDFSKIPFAFDGTVGGQLWELMEKDHQTEGLKSRKSPLAPDLIAGALRLFKEDIPAIQLRRMLKTADTRTAASH